jgi:signal transduction histidine kinase
MSQHVRHSVAKWFGSMSLSLRLSIFVALIVTAVVTSVAYVQVRLLERDIDRELVNAARLGATSVAENLAARESALDPLDIRDMLHDLVDAEPLIDAISVITADGPTTFRVYTSTSTEERAEVVALGGRAITTMAPTSQRSANTLTFAVPVPRRESYAVAASVGLESLQQASARSVGLAVGFALPAILLVTLLIQFTLRQLVGQPLGAILHTMEATAEGDWHARATVTRRDELGSIAIGLNRMLDQLERFNQSLHERVQEATRDLSLRNLQLAASRDQLLGLRESLGRAERVAALGQVAANVAHQAGTPLNLVSGYVQMIRDDPATSERIRSRLETVDTQIQQVTRVLRSLLDHARQQSGFETVSLEDIVGRVREIAEPRLARSEIRLQVAVPSDLPPIKADTTQLEMALLNLVTNALDAMPHGGTLSITASGRSGGVRLEIADTGPGIPSEIVDRLFEPWVTSKPAGRGTGLGLSIVRDVVRAHGGSVSASNQPTGAVFVVDLPAANPDRSVA